jgi:hypothetical protein
MTIWLDKTTAEVESFHFLLESGHTEYTQKYNAERASIVLLLNTTFLTVKAAAIDANVQATKWGSLKIFNDPAITTEYKTAIEAGKEDFRKVSQNIETIYSYLAPTGTTEPSSTCILYEFLFPEYELTEFNFLKKKMSKINKDWIAAELDGEKKLLLDTYVMQYNSIGEKWFLLTEKATHLLEKVVQKEFPTEFTSALEALECIQDSTREKVRVSEVKKSTDKVILELEVLTPTEKNEVIQLLHVPYKGYVLAPPTSTGLYVRKPGGTNALWNLECKDTDILNEHSPLCTLTAVDTLCTQALVRNDLEAALWQCIFTADKNPVQVQRLMDDGLFISTTNFGVADGNKVIYAIPPIVIYSNKEISLTKDTEEIKYPPLVKFATQKVVLSLLTTVQQTLVSTRGMISDYWSNINYAEYANYLAWALQLLTFPLPFIGLILTCRHRKLINKARKKLAKQDARKGRTTQNEFLLQRLDM